jgi:hypothetical protein
MRILEKMRIDLVGTDRRAVCSPFGAPGGRALPSHINLPYETMVYCLRQCTRRQMSFYAAHQLLNVDRLGKKGMSIDEEPFVGFRFCDERS